MSNQPTNSSNNQQDIAPNTPSQTQDSNITIDDSIRQLVTIVNTALDDMKAVDIVELDIGDMSTIADIMIVASGNSQRHVKAIANSVLEKAKEAGQAPIGVEGTDISEWILIDLGDIIVHVMLPKTRSFYDLEKLWSARPTAKQEGDAIDKSETSTE